MSPPSAPQSDDGEPQLLPPGGELARWPLLYLYYLAASRNVTGRLTLALPERTIQVFFRKGAPDGIESDHPDDGLLVFLVRTGALDASALAQARAENPAFDEGDPTTTLLGARLLDPQQLFAQLIRRAHAILLGCVVSDAGTFTFDAAAPPRAQAFPLGDRWGLLSALVRMLPASGLRQRLQAVWNRPVMKSGGNVEVVDLKLTPQETRALSRFDGVRSLEQLSAEHPQETDALMRLAFLLRHLEAVTFLAAPVAVAAAPDPHPGGPPPAPARDPARSAAAPPVLSASAPAGPAAARPSPVPPAAPPSAREATSRATPVTQRAAPSTPPPAPRESLEELRALRARLAGEDHFKRLGITQDAPLGAAKIAYFKLARLHHPDTVSPDAPAEMAKLKADIFAAIGEAYRTLSDEAARATYLEDLASGGEVDVRAILQAEELFTRASLLVKNRRFADAARLLEDAIVLNPEEGEFYAWRGWARFCAQPERDRTPGPAREDLEEALRRSPRCVAAHHFLGSLSKLCGNVAEAKVHFQRALDLKPDHVEAARELRILNAKR